MRTVARRAEHPLLVLAAGSFILAVMLVPVIFAIQLGWIPALFLGLVLVAVSTVVKTSDEARVLRWIATALGVLAVLGAVLDLAAG